MNTLHSLIPFTTFLLIIILPVDANCVSLYACDDYNGIFQQSTFFQPPGDNLVLLKQKSNL